MFSRAAVAAARPLRLAPAAAGLVPIRPRVVPAAIFQYPPSAGGFRAYSTGASGAAHRFHLLRPRLAGGLLAAGALMAAMASAAHAEQQPEPEQSQAEGAGQHDFGPQVEVVTTRAIKALFSVIRHKDCDRRQFQAHADRILRILSEEALARLPITHPVVVPTPCGQYDGLAYPNFDQVCAVSIMRSGDIPLNALQAVAPGISVGKLLCQRDEQDPLKQATISYSKLPGDIRNQFVILVDPMLATGGSCALAIEAIKAAGVPEQRICFVNLVSCPEGLRALTSAYPGVKIITAQVDERLNEDKFIVPGLGDFGDRYWGTGH